MKKILTLLFNYKFTTLLILYIWFISIYPINLNPSVPFLIAAFNIVAIVNLLSKFKYARFLIIPLGLIVSINAIISYLYKSPLTFGMYASILETNINEASSMMKNVVLPSIVFVALTLFLFYKSYLESKRGAISTKVSFAFILAYSLLFLPTLMYRRILVEELDEKIKEKPAFVSQLVALKYSPILYGNLLVHLTYKEEKKILLEFRKKERVLIDGITEKEEQQQVEKIYVIIGESANPRHHSVYGYTVPTTPFLDSLTRHNSNVYVYEAYASAPFARQAIPMILTFAHPQYFNLGLEKKSIIQMASDMGYSTVWISKQYMLDPSDLGLTTDYIAILASDADYRLFTSEAYSEDLDLIPMLRKMHKKKEKQFFVIHLAGSHLTYEDRYDKHDIEAISIEQSGNTTYYDRTVHHTDRVLREVYNVANNDSSSVLYYISDHGEFVNIGHGFGYSDIGIEQYEVPLITINNSSLPLDSIMSKYRNPDFGYITASSSSYILSETIGYTVSDSMANIAIENGKYVLQGVPTLIEEIK